MLSQFSTSGEEIHGHRRAWQSKIDALFRRSATEIHSRKFLETDFCGVMTIDDGFRNHASSAWGRMPLNSYLSFLEQLRPNIDNASHYNVMALIFVQWFEITCQEDNNNSWACRTIFNTRGDGGKWPLSS